MKKRIILCSLLSVALVLVVALVCFLPIKDSEDTLLVSDEIRAALHAKENEYVFRIYEAATISTFAKYDSIDKALSHAKIFYQIDKGTYAPGEKWNPVVKNDDYAEVFAYSVDIINIDELWEGTLTDEVLSYLGEDVVVYNLYYITSPMNVAGQPNIIAFKTNKGEFIHCPLRVMLMPVETFHKWCKYTIMQYKDPNLEWDCDLRPYQYIRDEFAPYTPINSPIEEQEAWDVWIKAGIAGTAVVLIVGATVFTLLTIKRKKKAATVAHSETTE